MVLIRLVSQTAAANEILYFVFIFSLTVFMCFFVIIRIFYDFIDFVYFVGIKGFPS